MVGSTAGKEFEFCLALLAVCMLSCSQETTLFTEIPGAKAGLSFSNDVVQNEFYNILTFEHLFNGGGVAISDFNNDGLQDAFFSGNIVDNKLFLNRGSLQFEDISEAAGIAAPGQWCSGITVVDLNRDGWNDIYVCATVLGGEEQRRNLLFINQGVDEQGIPTFVNKASEYGLDDEGYSTQGVFFDFDRDDDLDLYVLTNQLGIRSPNKFYIKRLNGTAPNNDRLYRNEGNGTFSDVTQEAGVGIEGYGLGINVFDVNEDGWLDIYVSNDYLSNDVLYLNNQDGSFSNRIGHYIKHQSHSSMGCDVADLNNDGRPDIMTVEMLPNDLPRMKRMWPPNWYGKSENNEKLGYGFQYMRNMLQINQGLGPDGQVKFGDLSFYAGVHASEWSWAVLLNDFDADGHKDIFIANGFPKDLTDMDFLAFRENRTLAFDRQALLDALPESKVSNVLFRNRQDLTFEDVSQAWGIGKETFSNGAAYGDLDNDGDLDLLVNNINDQATLLVNNSRDIHFLRVALSDDYGMARSLGAQVDVFCGQDTYTQHYMPVRGYLSCMEPYLFFGLGTNHSIDSVVVRWSDGTRQSAPTPMPNALLTVHHTNAAQSRPRRLAGTLFEESTGEIAYRHVETRFNDFNHQTLLPKQYSQLGPAMAAGDIDNNGEEDLILGGTYATVGTKALQEEGQFNLYPLEPLDKMLLHEDVGLLLFDVDADQDLDLYIVSGGTEGFEQPAVYADRLYINDGHGNFSLTYGAIPEMQISGSCVKGADIDQDGDVDLFVGGRIHPTRYPQPVASFILRNDTEPGGKPRFTDITDNVCPALTEAGMVSDALWTDFDNDNLPDLVIVGEWMSPRFFRNTGVNWVELREASGVHDKVGWWNCLVGGDFDNDGDTDYMAGNQGLNSLYQASQETPLHIFAKDFDGNGGYDAFLASSAGYADGALYPYHSWDDMKKQMVFLRKRKTKYVEYAHSSVRDLFREEELENVLHYDANWFHTSLIINLGGGSFEILPLPSEAQFAPVQSMMTIDLNDDEMLDVLLVGNYYGGELFGGRNDAFNGLVLYGVDGQSFRSENYADNGFLVDGDARSMICIPDQQAGLQIIVGQNRDRLRQFKLAGTAILSIPTLPGETWAEVQLPSGDTRKIERYHGNSALSQSSDIWILPASHLGFTAYHADGSISRMLAPEGAL